MLTDDCCCVVYSVNKYVPLGRAATAGSVKLLLPFCRVIFSEITSLPLISRTSRVPFPASGEPTVTFKLLRHGLGYAERKAAPDALLIDSTLLYVDWPSRSL